MHRYAGSSIVLAAASIAAAGIPPAPPPVPAPAGVAHVTATGRGRAPRQAKSEAQLRLMAKRAAVVEAYKNAARRMGLARSSPEGGTGVETVGGFIRGVELKEIRYYRGGDVEVDVEFTVPSPPGEPGPGEARGEDGAAGEGPLFVEKGGGPMAEEEWRAILGSGAASRP